MPALDSVRDMRCGRCCSPPEPLSPSRSARLPESVDRQAFPKGQSRTRMVPRPFGGKRRSSTRTVRSARIRGCARARPHVRSNMRRSWTSSKEAGVSGLT